MRPKLELYCDGVLLWSGDDPRTDDDEAVALTLAIGGPDYQFPWPRGADGKLVNPWRTSWRAALNAIFDDAGPDGSQPPADPPGTWRDRPPLL